MLTKKLNFQIIDEIVIIVLCIIIVLFPFLVYPSLVISLLYFLAKKLTKKRSLGVSIFRTIYALIGIITSPLFYMGPYNYISYHLDNNIQISDGSFVVFLYIYRIFFTMLLPISAFLSAYFLTVLDPGGIILPIILLASSLVIMLLAGIISEALVSLVGPLLVVFLILLIAHIIYFSKEKVKNQFDIKSNSIGLIIFHYIYCILGVISFYFGWYSIENMRYFAVLGNLHIEIGRLIFLILFAILCLSASSLIIRANIWGYRIPILILSMTILFKGDFLYLPILVAHIIFFNIPRIKEQFRIGVF